MTSESVLGDGTTTTRLAPVQVTGLTGATQDPEKDCAHDGIVISQTSAAGTSVFPGSAVSVTIGGPPPGGCP